MQCEIDQHVVPDAPDGREWVDDTFFGWVHKTTHWHTLDGTRLRRLRGALTFVAVWPHMPGNPGLLSPPAVSEDDLEPEDFPDE